MDPKLYRDRAIMAAISSAKDEMIEPDQYRIDAEIDWKLQKYAAVYAEYQAELKKNNAMDFDDLLVQTVKLFQQFPEVLDYYQEQFRYIMVDEYQDVNSVQDEIFRALSRDGNNLFMVGDVKQSIYRFRLADPLIFTDKYEKYAFLPDAREGEPVKIMLQENFRSRREVIDGINGVFEVCMSKNSARSITTRTRSSNAEVCMRTRAFLRSLFSSISAPTRTICAARPKRRPLPSLRRSLNSCTRA